MEFEETLNKLKEVKQFLEKDLHECPTFEDMDRHKEDYILLMAIMRYLEDND